MAYRPLRLALPVVLAALTASPAQSNPPEAPALRIDRATPDEISKAFRPLFVGVESIEIETTEPRPMRGHAIRVDLKAPGLSFFVSPSNGDRPLECDSITTSHFLARYKLQVAINAAPFSPVVSREGVPQDVVGLAVSRGERISDSHQGFGAILLTKDNVARLVEQPPGSLDGVENACGGFKLIIVDGKNVGPDDVLHPRSALGISRDGRSLILLVIDGRQKGRSEGATQKETAEWLLKLGVWSGLNLDGGGSSSLVVGGADGTPRILNRPIQSGVPGRERPCPNHLGLFAAALPSK